jgi:hypothetical protein
MRKVHQLTLTEQRRFDAQSVLDGLKTQAERNRMGQFATPFPLALEILSYANKLVAHGQDIRFLDPAFGTGAFYSALLRAFPADQIESAAGFEIDRHYGDPATELWGNTGLEIRLSDFTKEQPSRRGYNLVICNPPYVRHHHIVNGEKARIQAATRGACGVNFGGLSGLYCYFMGLSHAWMAEGGIAGWLIPSEFMDVNYGKEVKNYLLNKVRLLHVHRFDPFEIQFGDALVSSAVVWFRKEKPPPDYEVEFSFGGTLSVPKVNRMVSARDLRSEKKWTRFPVSEVRGKEDILKLSDFFSIQRGIATGDNDFFILTPQQIAEHGLPPDFFKPILPSPRYLRVGEVAADEFGNPAIENPLFLLDRRLPETRVKRSFPSLWKYFQEGKEAGVADRYLCQHRSPWYAQENRPAAPFVCTYLGRGNVKSGRPFRFILNQSRATVTNVYLALYPKPNLAQVLGQQPTLIRQVWEILNDISPNTMLAEGRVYGGGLHKLEPKELANVPAQPLADLFSKFSALRKNYTPYLQTRITDL